MRFGIRGRWLAVAAALAAGTAGAAGTAAAQTVTLGAQLTGAQERPTPVATTGFGVGQLTYDQATDRVTVNLSVQGLTSNTVAVGAGGSSGHVHVVTMANGNGPIALPLVDPGTLVADPTLINVRAFTYTGTFTFAQIGSIAGISADAVALLRTRLLAAVGSPVGSPVQAYFNVHTVGNPAGEIRGDLAVVPEPSTYALVAAGLAGVGGLARRRRQRQGA